jgi:hypothetical protein
MVLFGLRSSNWLENDFYVVKKTLEILFPCTTDATITETRLTKLASRRWLMITKDDTLDFVEAQNCILDFF